MTCDSLRVSMFRLIWERGRLITLDLTSFTFEVASFVSEPALFFSQSDIADPEISGATASDSSESTRSRGVIKRHLVPESCVPRPLGHLLRAPNRRGCLGTATRAVRRPRIGSFPTPPPVKPCLC